MIPTPPDNKLHSLATKRLRHFVLRSKADKSKAARLNLNKIFCAGKFPTKIFENIILNLFN